jgi:predicted Zn-dependent protease
MLCRHSLSIRTDSGVVAQPARAAINHSSIGIRDRGSALAKGMRETGHCNWMANVLQRTDWRRVVDYPTALQFPCAPLMAGGQRPSAFATDSTRSSALEINVPRKETEIMQFFRVLFILATTVVVASCQSAPVTGRQQLMLVPESQAIEASTAAYAQVLAPIKKEGKLNDNVAMKARVDKITARLVAQAIKYRPETESWDWQVAVIDDPKTLNAWCMAGGKMAIYSGIITQLNLSDDEIAQVMGHEIAHALAKHTAERMSTAMASDAALQIGAMLLGVDSAKSQIAMQAAAAATTVGVQLPNSRSQESEADRIGIELAAKAGYDPRAAPTLWGKMIQASGSKGQSDFLSTHPQSEKRQEALAALVPQMLPYYEDKSPRPEHQLKTA